MSAERLIRIEGHTDERPDRAEYNMALGPFGLSIVHFRTRARALFSKHFSRRWSLA